MKQLELNVNAITTVEQAKEYIKGLIKERCDNGAEEICSMVDALVNAAELDGELAEKRRAMEDLKNRGSL